MNRLTLLDADVRQPEISELIGTAASLHWCMFPIDIPNKTDMKPIYSMERRQK